MNTELLHQVEKFKGLEVLVIGEAMLDSYLRGRTDRLCEEAPVPIISNVDRMDVPGGAANTAVNIQELGGRVRFLSVIGQDEEGRLLRKALERRGVGVEDLVTDPERQTLAKHRVIGSVQMLVRFDRGSTAPVGSESEGILIERLEKLFRRCDAVVISDYGYGICTPRLIEALADLQSHAPRILVADSKHLGAYREVGATAVKPNYSEAAELLGLSKKQGLHARIDQMTEHGEQMLDETGARIAAVTLDSDGALIFERGRPLYRTYAQPVIRAHAAGAGDTFTAALALTLGVGANAPAAAELASAAAAVAVGKEGTAACSADELHGYLFAEEKHVGSRSRLDALLTYYRRQNRRIVFTNGCFDILHRGHITYLSRAKALGDVLIIGLNSDASVRRLKGDKRPINRWEDRAQVLAALSCVDHVISFDENTPNNLIREVGPDIFVKGGDYSREMLPEAELVEQLGGSVEILPYVDDYSTTSLVEQIRGGYKTAANGHSKNKY